MAPGKTGDHGGKGKGDEDGKQAPQAASTGAGRSGSPASTVTVTGDARGGGHRGNGGLSYWRDDGEYPVIPWPPGMPTPPREALPDPFLPYESWLPRMPDPPAFACPPWCPNGVGCPCSACQCQTENLTKPADPGVAPEPAAILLPVGDTGQAHFGVSTWPGSGMFMYLRHSGGVTGDYLEIRYVDGSVYVMEKVSGIGIPEYHRPLAYVDVYDNRTEFKYGQAGTPAARKLGPVKP